MLGVKSLIQNASSGNVGGAIVDGIGVIADAVSMAVPFVPGGVGTAISAVRAANKVDNAVDAGTNIKKGSTILENAKNGKAFEDLVDKTLGKDKASQVMIEIGDGTKTRMDFVENIDGKFRLIETKSSNSAPLTKNQKKHFLKLKQGEEQ